MTLPLPDPLRDPVPDPLPPADRVFRPGRARPVRPVDPLDPPPISALPVTAPYPMPYRYVPVPVPTNGLAVASLICSIAGVASCFVLSILGTVFGHVARRQIRVSGEGGDGLALAGVIIGWIGVSILLLCCGGYLALVGFGVLSGSVGQAG
jgi:hypothetical protein